MRAGLRRGVRGGVVGAALLCATALATVLGAGPAAASDAEDVIRSYDMTIELDDDGTAHVMLLLAVDFGLRPNHGPYLRWVVKERYDDERDRVYRITDFHAGSDSASGEVATEELLGSGVAETAFRIGSEDATETGLHEYVVTFDAEGWVNPAGYPFPEGELAQDELYLDVLTHWDIPVENARVTVRGPAEVLDAACYEDSGTCRAEADGVTTTLVADRVEPGTPLTVAVAYPAGTFVGAEPLLQERWAFSRAFAVTPVTAGLAGVVALGGGALLLRRGRRSARDEQYLGLTPGLAPASGQEGQVGERRRSAVAVQFAPPEGFHAGQLGTLVDEVADPRDVTATIVDLAVRGYLTIVRLPSPDGSDDGDWRLDRAHRGTEGLLAFERLLMEQVFLGSSSVTLSELRTTFAAAMAAAQDSLYEDVTQRGWFRGNPKAARQRWALLGVLLLVGGVVVTGLLAMLTHLALVGVPLVVLGVAWLAMTRSAPARTADGSAVLAQAEGFRLYLATAEANQLRFEEGEDLFSRYLPFAVAFGLTERWAGLFAQLAAQGRALAEPTWFVGAYAGHYAFWATASTLGQDLSSFTSTATSAFSAPSPGSSGGSGFSGGGFGGGGVGGGGGGTW